MKFTDEQRQKARDLAGDLIAMGLDWGLTYSPKTDMWSHYCGLNWMDWLNDNNKSLQEMGICYGGGATKVAFYFAENPEWVIKAAYLRETNPEYGETQDYCERENEVYELACLQMLEGYLAHTEFLEEISGIKFYIQEYAAGAIGEIFEKFRSYVVDEYQLDSELYEEEINSRAEYLEDEEMLCAVFGVHEGGLLYSFLENEMVNDLHEGNYGITRDGRTVLIDFSGY